MITIGEALIRQLAMRGVDCVFGIPGVHTVELYRGLAASGIRHVSPRHEQGAGFMADGYARASGKPGVALVITGPGFTNILTAMGQARSDSIPMLVISGVNELATLGKGLGHLHELTDQLALSRTVALASERVERAEDLVPTLDHLFEVMTVARPGPVHLELPLDVARLPYNILDVGPCQNLRQAAPADSAIRTAEILLTAKLPIILVGGGGMKAAAQIRELAVRLDAPVVQTVNARGLMFKHSLGVPASPSLDAVRSMIEEADAVLALGTELGSTDYDMYATGQTARMQNLIRVEICSDQLERRPADIKVLSDVAAFVSRLLEHIHQKPASEVGTKRAGNARTSARHEIGPAMLASLEILETIRNAAPNSVMVGDSTQPVYAGNLYYDHDRPGGWFNSATGFGSLGFGIPAAIGAAVALPGTRVICLVGDGGAQFSLPEIMTAVDEHLPIVFVIWNNRGYLEIDQSMRSAGVTVVGCDPTPPHFPALATSFGMKCVSCAPNSSDVRMALKSLQDLTGPSIIEIRAHELN